MYDPEDKKYFIASTVFHAALLLVIVLSYEFSAPLIVVENTNQHDVISAVVLGDTAKSKILPHEKPSAPKPEPTPPPKAVAKVEPKPRPMPEVKPVVDEQAIALKAAEKKAEEKKLVEQKEAEKKLADKKDAEKKLAELKKKQQALLAKDLLADIKKQNDKKIKKKTDLQAAFAKTLREQSEESLRQNLMNDNIKLSTKTSHQSQGIVNKYTALIQQVIGEHWLVPGQANKKLTSELMIRLAPGGAVLDVQVTRSSGDPALDSSARAAVMKSSPLPVPTNPEEFEPFRQFVLKVRPENIIET
jgi:colicin import membrane protein